MMVVELLFTSMSVSEIRQVVTYTFYNMLGELVLKPVTYASHT